jgi:hypothetical protein
LILYNDNDKFYLEGISYRAGKFNIQIKEDEVLSQKEQVEKLKIYYDSVLKEDSAELFRSTGTFHFIFSFFLFMNKKVYTFGKPHTLIKISLLSKK